MHGMTAWGGRLGPRAGGPNRSECILVSMERLQAEWGGGTPRLQWRGLDTAW